MKPWQKMLKNEIHDSGTIRVEIQKLKDSRQKMKADSIELESSLGDLQRDLLAEDSPGALEQVTQAERAISESRSKIAAIASILDDLGTALEKALANEQARRQSKIISEVAVIDEQIAETRLEIVEHFAKAAALYENATGQDPTKFGFDFIFNNRLIDAFSKRIEEFSTNGQGSSLYQKRQALSTEAARLRKGIA